MSLINLRYFMLLAFVVMLGEAKAESITLQLGQHFQSGDKVRLGRLISQQHPHINLQGKEIRDASAYVMANSQGSSLTLSVKGINGSAAYIPYVYSRPGRIDRGGGIGRGGVGRGGIGRGGSVGRRSINTYQTVMLQAPFGQTAHQVGSRLGLVLRVNGFVTINSVTINLKPNRIALEMYGQVFNGQNVIRIRQLLQAQHPGVILRDLNVKRVIVFAKSVRGGATVALQNRQPGDHPSYVPGSPRLYNSVGGFTRIVLQNNLVGGRGMQLALTGNLKIQKIVLAQGGGGSVRPLPPVPVSYQCQVDLKNIRRGNVIDSFSAMSVTKSMACTVAKAKCQSALNARIGARGGRGGRGIQQLTCQVAF